MKKWLSALLVLAAVTGGIAATATTSTPAAAFQADW